MTLYRPSRRSIRTWHIVASEIDDLGVCGAEVEQTNKPPWDYIQWGRKECLKCDRIQNPRPPKVNVGEQLMKAHLGELAREYLDAGATMFEEQYRYVPGRLFKADFAVPSIRLLIEVQGGIYTGKAHGSVNGILLDNERINLAALNGWRVMRFSPQQVATGEAKEWVRKVLEMEETE